MVVKPVSQPSGLGFDSQLGIFENNTSISNTTLHALWYYGCRPIECKCFCSWDYFDKTFI